jgi:hypothetical protein
MGYKISPQPAPNKPNPNPTHHQTNKQTSTIFHDPVNNLKVHASPPPLPQTNAISPLLPLTTPCLSIRTKSASPSNSSGE